MKVILVDIDNTLLSQNRRKQKILFDTFGVEISLEKISRDFSLETTIKGIAHKKEIDYQKAKADFEAKFFSNLYYDDTDLFDVIGNSNYVLNELYQENEFEVIYLTSRDPELAEQTLAQLVSKNYPCVDDKHVIFARAKEENLENYGCQSFNAKKEAIRLLRKQYHIIAHIGDQASDAASSYIHDISSVVLSDNEEGILKAVAELLNSEIDQIDPYGILCIPKWDDIKEYLFNRLGKSSSISDACNIHAENYASWMADLDQKSSLILVISTFSASIFLSFMTDHGTQLLLLCLSGLGFLFSLISMFFAIKSFSSRVTHGRENILKVLFSYFKRDYKSNVFSPLHERKKAGATTFQENLGAKYLYRRFSSFNGDCFSAKNMINLRAANYEKIYPEFCAKLCLIVSIFFLFTIGCLSLFPSSATQNIFNNQISLSIVENNEIMIPNIYSFETADFDFSNFSLSQSGCSKLEMIVENYSTKPSQDLYLHFNPDEGNDLSDFLLEKKTDLQLSIVYEALKENGIDIKVVLIKNGLTE